MDPMPEPTSDVEPESAAMSIIAPEPEFNRMSDQVRETATLSMPVSVLVEFEEMEWSPTHSPSAKYYEDLEEDFPREYLCCSHPAPSLQCLHWFYPAPSLLHLQWPTQPPSPTFSTKDSQAFGPDSTVSLQSLSSSSDSTLLHGSTPGLPVSCSALARGAPGST